MFSFVGLANAWPGAGEWQERPDREGAGKRKDVLVTSPLGAILYSLELCHRDPTLKMPTVSLPQRSHSFLGKENKVDGS